MFVSDELMLRAVDGAKNNAVKLERNWRPRFNVVTSRRCSCNGDVESELEEVKCDLLRWVRVTYLPMDIYISANVECEGSWESVLNCELL